MDTDHRKPNRLQPANKAAFTKIVREYGKGLTMSFRTRTKMVEVDGRGSVKDFVCD